MAARADLPSHRRRGTEEGPKPSAPSSRCPRLEPYDKRLSRTVLRGLGGRKAPRLPDRFRAEEFGREDLRRRLIPLQGMAIGELWDLEALAADCSADGVYEFMLVSAPLNVPGAVGSPANAYAIK